MIAFTFIAGVVAVAGFANAAPNPTEPSSASVFNAGSTCTIKWDADATGSWKQMNIQLMTGDNWKMVHVTTVAQDIDATDATKNTYEYTCPEVTPNSAIYFYQFSSPSDPKNLLWTTRWAIASADGQLTPPTETTQPDGQKIPWGTGALVDPSEAVAAPSYLSGSGQAGGSTTGSTTSGAASTGASTSAGGSSANASTSSAASASPSAAPAGTMTTTRATSARSASGSATGTPSGSAASSSPSTNAALGGGAPGVVTVLGAVLAAVGLF